MLKDAELVISTLLRCSDENDLKACDKCPYRKWSKDYFGDARCKNLLMRDAYDLLNPKLPEIQAQAKENTTPRRLSKLDAKDVTDFFMKLVKLNKHALFEAGMSGGELYTWSTGRSTPKLAKFVSVLRACGYDINIIRRKD